MLVDGLVLSYMGGTIHPYYCLSLAPAVAGTFAIGVHEMWSQRSSWFGRVGLAVLIGAPGCGAGGSWAAMRSGCPNCAGRSWC